MRRFGVSSLMLVMLGAAPASAQGCEEAWYQRNLIYKPAPRAGSGPPNPVRLRY